MIADVVERRIAGARHPRRGLGPRRQLALQQLEVNRHRIQRVLHLVGDAGGEPAERRELARVPDRRLHGAERAEVARDDHHAQQPLVAVLDGMRDDQPVARAALALARRQRHRHRLGRLARVARAIDERVERLLPSRSHAASSARSAGLANSTSPFGPKMPTASARCSTIESRPAAGPVGLARRRAACRSPRESRCPSSPNSSCGRSSAAAGSPRSSRAGRCAARGSAGAATAPAASAPSVAPTSTYSAVTSTGLQRLAPARCRTSSVEMPMRIVPKFDVAEPQRLAHLERAPVPAENLAQLARSRRARRSSSSSGAASGSGLPICSADRSARRRCRRVSTMAA